MNDSQKLSHVIDMAAAANFVEAKLSTLGQRLTGNRAPATSSAAPVTAPRTTSSESERERPYADPNQFGQLNAAIISNVVFNRFGQPAIDPDLRAALQKAQRQDRRLTKKILEELTFDGMVRQTKRAKARIKAGKGSEADVLLLDRASQMEIRRAVKRQRIATRQSAAKLLVPIAQSIEALCRKALPGLEMEARALGIDPAAAPVVRAVATGCWLPSVIAAAGVDAPGAVLRKLGIKL